MVHRSLFFIGMLLLWVSYKHQQWDRFLGIVSNSPKEISNPTSQGLENLQTSQTESLIRIKTLIDSGSIHSRNRFGSTPFLLAACQNGELNVVEYLYSHGARLQDRDLYGNTALMCAAEAGNLRLVNWLLDRGVQVNQKNRIGQTALYFAAREGKYRTVKALLEKGAKSLMKDHLGQTASHAAIKNRHMKVAKLLGKTKKRVRIAIKTLY